MNSRNFPKLNWLAVVLVLHITFLLISDATAAKIVMVLGYPVSISVLYFPITYILADIITEVYGYKIARQILWMSIICSAVAGTVYQLAAYYPPAFPFEGGGDPYNTVFAVVLRVMVAGWIAVFAGDISNNYVLAKLKVATKGAHFWLRAIASTFVGQFVNTVIFYIIALYGILPNKILLVAIISGWLMKVGVEVILLPVTYKVVAYLKRVEGVDTYDFDTDFNPFLFK
ncbi:MAG: queuosine precursor transporter [Gammaproteobacteria bacterium]|nr:queuosine precursor transporter [Gammaproteobacteria bacterium]